MNFMTLREIIYGMFTSAITQYDAKNSPSTIVMTGGFHHAYSSLECVVDPDHNVSLARNAGCGLHFTLA